MSLPSEGIRSAPINRSSGRGSKDNSKKGKCVGEQLEEGVWRGVWWMKACA